MLLENIELFVGISKVTLTFVFAGHRFQIVL